MSAPCVMTRARHDHRIHRAFSLIEVLVVIAIITFMLAMLVPGMSTARERARRLTCANNQRQWGVALHLYRDAHNDFLPTEGTYQNGGILKPGTWYNELPPYLGLPPYRDFEGANEAIEEFPNIHIWICPSKNLTEAYKSDSGKNQFHYGMNQVLDGLGKPPEGSRDTPDFPDQGAKPLAARFFSKEPHTVFMFDIAPNSPAGSPRDVATMLYRDYEGKYCGKFHGDYANILYLTGEVGHCTTDDLVTGRDLRHGEIVWDNPRLYWGYRPPPPEEQEDEDEG